MFITLIESENANMAIEQDTFHDALKVANGAHESQDWGKVHQVQIFETDKIVMGTENIKKECKLIASLRTIR